MFKKIIDFVQFMSETNDATFNRIRDTLREILLPRGFAEEKPPADWIYQCL